MIGLQSGKVEIIDYQKDWSYEYNIEKEILLGLIGEYILDIQHIGSTSILNCSAKPIIDIAIAIKRLNEVDDIIRKLVTNSYEYHGDAGIPGRHFFTKGKREQRTHYIHIEEINGKLWNNHILFRNYLNQNKEYISEYIELKKMLAKKYPEDREKYTESKNEFIENIINRAIMEIETKGKRPTTASTCQSSSNEME